jgi:predicted amidohydrolase
MKFGVVQPKNLPGFENVPLNRETNGEAIIDLFNKGADLVVLPECSNHQYIISSKEEVDQYAEGLDGESVAYWTRLASTYKKYIVGGILEQSGDDVYNTAVLVGPEGYIGHYRKVHLFNWERNYLSEGNLGFPVFHLKEFDINIGILICYDLRFTEAVRTLAMKGCDCILVPTTWTAIGKKMLWDEKGYCLANYNAIAHTYSNKLGIVCANRAGVEGGVQNMGASIIIDPYSNVVAGPASPTDAEQLIGEFDPHESRDKRVGNENHVIEDRRPAYYFN